MDGNLDWAALVIQAIDDCTNGIPKPVPGAKLRVQVARRASERECDLTELLRARGQTFAQFIEGLGQFTVLRRPGTDMLVGRSTGDFDEITTAGDEAHRPKSIRQDLYNALVDLRSAITYVYEPSTDTIATATYWKPEAVTVDGKIPLPKSSLGP